ncbi:sporulation-specific protein 22 [Oleoguttula sp. CCFEE 5521]
MPSLKTIRKDAALKHLQREADFATSICTSLKDGRDIPTNVYAELKSRIQQLWTLSLPLQIIRPINFDHIGTSIWNHATNIIRAAENETVTEPGRRESAARSGVLLRTYAYLLLDLATENASSRSQHLRLFKVGLKTARYCLAHESPEIAMHLLEKCSVYATNFEDAQPAVVFNDEGDSSRMEKVKDLATGLWLLRMLHSCKVMRSDLAEHFFAKASASLNASATLSYMAAEICYDASRSTTSPVHPKDGLQWLERALKLMESDCIADLELDTEDLRISVAVALTARLLECGDADSMDRAKQVADSLSSRYGLGDRLTVLRMHLTIALKQGDEHTIDQTLHRIVSVTLLTDITFDIILRLIYGMRKAHAQACLSSLEQLVRYRLLPDLTTAMETDEVHAWLEKAAVTYTSVCTATALGRVSEPVAMLIALFDAIVNAIQTSVSAKATHTMQTLIWNASAKSTGEDAKSWLHLLQHSLFDSAGVVNKARIGRKAIENALDRNDLDAARAAYFQMPETARDENASRYLAFKIALCMNDTQMASDCLDALMKQSIKDPKYLYACVLEAQTSNNRAMAVAAFQRLVTQPPQGVHLPVLLRCTARLYIAEMDQPNTPPAEVMHELLRVFDIAADNIKSFRQGSEDQCRAEIQWWSKNSYNLALRLCSEVHPEYVVRLAKTCVRFLSCLPEDDGKMHQDNILDRRRICHFLAATALTVLGRSYDDGTEESLQYYTEVRKEVQAYTTPELVRPGDKTDPLAAARTLELYKFDLEAILKLQQWSTLKPALERRLQLDNIDRWDTLVDIVLIIHKRASALNVPSSSTTDIPALLSKIINEVWRQDREVTKLARWIRVTFMIISTSGEDDGGISLKLVDQAIRMAQVRQNRQDERERYPEEELQWLATTAFNRAVDLLASDERKEAEGWVSGALNLARYADDSGLLHKHLTRNRDEAMKRLGRRNGV